MVAVYVMAKTYDSYGGQPTLSVVAHHLQRELDRNDCRLTELSIDAWFRRSGLPRLGLEGLHATFEREARVLPRLRFENKKRRLSVAYLSRLGLAEDVIDRRQLSASLFQRSLKEIGDLLDGAHARFRRKQGLDYPALLDSIHRSLAFAPSSDAELAALAERYHGEDVTARAQLSWWERLDIDWDDYHPKARELLDDPFFWDAGDDYAPHGNDTGADLLSAFRKWRRSHREAAPLTFLRILFRRWGMLDAIYGRHDPDPARWEAEDEIAILTYDQAAIALAFAVLKLEGARDGPTLAAALDAIARQREPAVVAHFGGHQSNAPEVAFTKLEAKLKTLPTR